MPLSHTSTWRWPGRAVRRMSIWPPASRQNFTAFESRLITACMRRSRSPRTGGTWSGRLRAERIFFSSASWRIEESASRHTSRRSTGSFCHSIFPVSIFWKSRTWLIRRVRRSLSLTMRAVRVRCRSSGSRGLAFRISAMERTAVSGVRSSWVTVVMNSSLRRSSSLRRRFADFSSAWALSSSRL